MNGLQIVGEFLLKVKTKTVLLELWTRDMNGKIFHTI